MFCSRFLLKYGFIQGQVNLKPGMVWWLPCAIGYCPFFSSGWGPLFAECSPISYYYYYYYFLKMVLKQLLCFKVISHNSDDFHIDNNLFSIILLCFKCLVKKDTSSYKLVTIESVNFMMVTELSGVQFGLKPYT